MLTWKFVKQTDERQRQEDKEEGVGPDYWDYGDHDAYFTIGLFYWTSRLPRKGWHASSTDVCFDGDTDEERARQLKFDRKFFPTLREAKRAVEKEMHRRLNGAVSARNGERISEIRTEIRALREELRVLLAEPEGGR